jgi:hypothetical protein
LKPARLEEAALAATAGAFIFAFVAVVANWSTEMQAAGGAAVVAAGALDWVVAHVTHGRAWLAGPAVVGSTLSCVLVGLALIVVVVHREPWREIFGAAYLVVVAIAVMHVVHWLRRRRP